MTPQMVHSESSWVALVGPEIEENLSLRYLAASLSRAGIASEIIAFNDPHDLSSVLEIIIGASPRPFMAVLSLAFQWRAADFLGLAVALRERGYTGHITAGGHFGTFTHPSLMRDFPELDSICLYEAEESLVALAHQVSAGMLPDRIDGLAWRNREGGISSAPPRVKSDIASLPWPDRRGEPATCLGHPIANLVGSRGCYAHCAFCCISAWHRMPSEPKRLRLRSVSDIADEMVALNRDKGIEIFIFHDDNFFLRRHYESVERIEALADALEARGMGPFATVVKARPDDIVKETFETMKARLKLIRLFLGIESHAHQGLRTLSRGVGQAQNEQAMRVLDDLHLYVCFNMLIFDPDTTRDSFNTNLAFMEAHGDAPHNFGRVELYAGTPLLARMQAEGRCRGDYMGYDYRLADEEMQEVFEITKACFYVRNFGKGALANRLQGTRFDVEVCRYFHPDRYRTTWLEEVKKMSRRLTGDSVAALREISQLVQSPHSDRSKRAFVRQLSQRLRACEAEVRAAATDLEERIQESVGARCQHVRPHPRQRLNVRIPDAAVIIDGDLDDRR